MFGHLVEHLYILMYSAGTSAEHLGVFFILGKNEQHKGTLGC